MTKSELIQLLAEKHADQHLYHRDYQRVVNRVFTEISDALAQGDRVELRGFGAFSVRPRAARVGRNPRTGRCRSGWIGNSCRSSRPARSCAERLNSE